MSTSDIINAILAGITFLGIIAALLFGVQSIRQTSNIQKTQYREKISDRILNWLNSYAECDSKYNVSNLSEHIQTLQNAVTLKIHNSIIAGQKSNDFRKLTQEGILLVGLCQSKEGILLTTMRQFNNKLTNLTAINYKYYNYFHKLSVLPSDFSKVEAVDKQYMDEINKVHVEAIDLMYKITEETIKWKDAK